MNTQESMDAAKLTAGHRLSPAGDGSRSNCKPSRMPCHAREDLATTTITRQPKKPAAGHSQEEHAS